jgi:fermentation-respiration switch protein FrsA (DUF1100 family)
MWDKLIAPFLYFPTRAHESSPEQYGLTYADITLTPEDAVSLHGWWFSTPQAMASLLFCHGNAGNISHRLDNIAHLVAVGFNILIFDYRGYGLSQGQPSEAGLYQDAMAAWDHFLELASPPRLIFGRSLGGAVAIELARHVQKDGLDGLIIESTFTSLGDMAGQVLPLPGIKWLVDGYPSLHRLKTVQTPLLAIHGERDELIPFRQGQQLFEAANPPKFFYPIPKAGHNDTYLVGGRSYFERLVSFARFSGT